MGPILRLALELAGLSARQSVERAAQFSILLIVALVFVMIGMAGFTVAFWIVLAHATNPVAASLLIGGLGFLIAGILALIARSQLRTRRETDLAQPLQQAEQAVSEFLQKADGGTVLGALGVAALVGFLITGRK